MHAIDYIISLPPDSLSLRQVTRTALLLTTLALVVSFFLESLLVPLVMSVLGITLVMTHTVVLYLTANAR